MRISQLLPSVRVEVEKPFQEKLERAWKLVKLYANRNSCVSCSFGKDSTVVLWMCLQENPNIPVIFNNTGVAYHETLQFKEYLRKEWNLNLYETTPIKNFWQIAREYGLPNGRKRSDRCCDYLKEIPFRQLIKQQGWRFCFTGITALESRVRMFQACERGQQYYSRKDGIWKVHPILYWTPEEVWNFIRQNQIPVNPAYQKYSLDRIGCVPCTSHKGWREQLARVNPKMYRFIQERFFHQKLLEIS